MFNAELLTSEQVLKFIKNAFSKKMDALQISTALAKEYSNEQRVSIMDYMALIPKIREKFSVAKIFEKNAAENESLLICDKLALEQSTAKDIGQWKANLWPATGIAADNAIEFAAGTATKITVHDLCCGMGGDSFYLPKNLDVVGVDLDENRLAMYRHNTKVMRGTFCEKAGTTILGDVREIAKANTHADESENTRADYFTIDPARRAVDGENQRDLRNLTPTLDEVVEIARHYKGGMAKLPPGYPVGEIPDECEIVYVGGHGDCRECLVLFGELARNPATMRAVMVDKNGEEIAKWSRKRDKDFEILDDELQEKLDRNDQLEGRDRTYRTSSSKSDLPIGEIADYISEPAALLVRSRLFGQAATEASPDAHLISEGIAYVASSSPMPAPGFASFKVLDHCEISTGAVRAMLKKHDIGKLTLKLRGVKVDPDAEIKRLKSKGKNPGILFYTRMAGEKVAILTQGVNHG